MKTTNNLKIEQHVPHYKPEVNTSAPELMLLYISWKQMYLYDQHLII